MAGIPAKAVSLKLIRYHEFYMNLSDIISEEEEKNLKPLENFFLMKWADTNLPSHDLHHLRRVWMNVKEILNHYTDPDIKRAQISNLLMAAFLHDIGMSRDQGIRHGFQGKMAAEEYISIGGLRRTDYEDALNAIEFHDNKSYDFNYGNNQVLKIQSVADDLDAFGTTGIWRYTEIYRAREIPEEITGYRILENAASRFENFKSFSSDMPLLFRKHSMRYNVLRRYFENYNRNLAKTDPGLEAETGLS